jgi:hypothetical protein
MQVPKALRPLIQVLHLRLAIPRELSKRVKGIKARLSKSAGSDRTVSPLSLQVSHLPRCIGSRLIHRVEAVYAKSQSGDAARDVEAGST